MKYVYFFIIVLAMFSFTSFSNEKHEEYSLESVIDSVVSNYNKYYSMSYDMCAHTKHVGEQDTIVKTYNCMYYRLDDDILNCCYIYSHGRSGIDEYYYPGRTIHIINHKLKQIKIIPYEGRDKRTNSREIHQLVYEFGNYFFNIEKLEEMKTDTSKKVSLTYNEKEFILKQEREWTNEEYNEKYSTWNELIIDKNSYNIIRRTTHLDFNGQIQHCIYDMKNIKYNDFDTFKTSMETKIDSLESIYEVE